MHGLPCFLSVYYLHSCRIVDNAMYVHRLYTQYVHCTGIHATGFKDYLLKEPLIQAIISNGFEHPSEGEPSVRQVRPHVVLYKQYTGHLIPSLPACPHVAALPHSLELTHVP